MYYCDLCNKSFTQRNDIRRHLNRKKICAKETEDLTVSYVCNKYGIILSNDDLPHKTTQNTTQNIQYIKNYTQEIQNLKCEYCNKIFTRADSKERHIKNFCKIRNNVKMNTINSHNVTHNTTINNITNNIQNIQNNIINKTEIKINSFGSENISYITDDILKKVKQNPEMAIPKLVELIHFNPKYPENHNIKMENKKDKYIDMYFKDKWTYVDIKDALHDLIVTKKKITDTHLEEDCDEQCINDYKRFTNAIDFYMNKLLFKDNIPPSMKGNKRLYSKLEKQILLLILDQRRQIEEEYKNNIHYISN